MALGKGLGALITLIGLLTVYLQSGAQSFDLVALTSHVREHPISPRVQRAVFPVLMFGFGILVSLWPFHTWAPLGYGAAPTATAMLHAGVLKKFGLYGLIRIAVPLLPEGARCWLPTLAVLCLGNILYCGLVAIRQKDLNGLIGNSSVAHMGLVFLGIASLSLIGLTGALTLMIAHGFLAALAFGLSGYLYQQTGSLEMSRMGGYLRLMPFWGTALMMAMLAGCGLPGWANFVGEILVFFGAWKSYPAITILACWGAVVMGAVYMLRAVRTILHGPRRQPAAPRPADLPHLWYQAPFILLLGVLLLFGVFPRLLTDRIQPGVEAVMALFPERPETASARAAQITSP